MVVSDVVEATGVRAYDVKEILSAELRRHGATKIGGRRLPGRDRIEEVWACTCRLDHHKPGDERRRVVPLEPLTAEDRDRGRAGVAAARAALDQARERRVS